MLGPPRLPSSLAPASAGLFVRVVSTYLVGEDGMPVVLVRVVLSSPFLVVMIEGVIMLGDVVVFMGGVPEITRTDRTK
jgi:hypothetical protein